MPQVWIDTENSASILRKILLFTPDNIFLEKREKREVKTVKKRTIIAGLLTASVVVLMFNALPVFARDEYHYWIVDFSVSSAGNVWILEPQSIYASPKFSGSAVDPDTVTATIYTTPTTSITVTPLKVIATSRVIVLIFDPATLPESADSTSVWGTFIDDYHDPVSDNYLIAGYDYFTAAGPGFTWS